MYESLSVDLVAIKYTLTARFSTQWLMRQVQEIHCMARLFNGIRIVPVELQYLRRVAFEWKISRRGNHAISHGLDSSLDDKLARSPSIPAVAVMQRVLPPSRDEISSLHFHETLYKVRRGLASTTKTKTTMLLPNVEADFPLAPGFTRVYLCRHGQTDYNVEERFQGRGINSELNATGQIQAKKLGLAFQETPLDALYCSFLTRAKVTAAAIGAYHGLAPAVVDGLEEMYFGSCEGRKLDELHDLWAATVHAWIDGKLDSAWPDGGESPLEVEARGTRALLSVLQTEPPPTRIALVCHGRFNKLLLASLLLHDMTKVETLTQDNTCINILDFHHESKTFTARVLNYTGHWEIELPK
ncbi:Aste57867_25437 [Aphanomyces stellatus]|uniref:Aste57867_25437 protein n=1 Tax=Aphanomyces stellatus TaxID=120398 RepID=A0A485LT16_9STRA|nr:hypothetical protein As57867_025358 [Aphanomyces stellatus]VFU02060.1 Aste57867_25437 [Aphanomyces stellatus]